MLHAGDPTADYRWSTKQMNAQSCRVLSSCFSTMMWLLVICSSVVSDAQAQGSTRVVSRSAEGVPANTYCFDSPLVSDDGRYVVYSTYADNLVPNDIGGWSDVFRTDMSTGATVRVSVSALGVEGDQPSYESWISADGRYILMNTYASNLVPGVSSTVQTVVLKDMQTGIVELISKTPSGTAPDADSGSASMSSDLRYVAFVSEGTDLDPLDVNQAADVFLYDRQLGMTTRITQSTAFQAESGGAEISRDGRFVVFSSRAPDLVAGDTNGYPDVFLYEVATGSLALISRPSPSIQANQESYGPSLSADGRWVAFRSQANNFVAGDLNNQDDVVVLDRQTGSFQLASLSSTGEQNNLLLYFARISANGRYVVLNTPASNLVPLDLNTNANTFVRDLVLATTECVDVGPNGLPVAYGGDNNGGISADGRFVAFRCLDANITPNPWTSPSGMVLLRDRQACQATIAIYCTAGITTHGCSPSIAASGLPSATAGSGFTISVSGVDGQVAGICFYGTRGPAALPFAGGSSVLCVQAPLQRTPVQFSGGTVVACDGQFALDWNAYIAAHPGALGNPFRGGETVWAQHWFRDALAPGGANLSNALWFSVCP